MTRLLLAALILALAGCAPDYACQRYGFREGTTAFSQCVQAEVLAYQNRMAGKK